MGKYYTGVGSRNTPPAVMKQLKKLAIYLDNKGWTVRSGGAEGADTAFEVASKKVIYLPWKDFNGKKGVVPASNNIAVELARRHHPKMIRSTYQVLGDDLNSPSKFLLCWTPDGATSDKERSYKTGGTGLAISIASEYNVPVFNLRNKGAFEKFRKFLETLENKPKETNRVIGLGKIILSDIRKARSFKSDEIWLITQGGRNITNFRRVPELAPNPQLFQRYLKEWKGLPGHLWWNEYSKEFAKQLKNSETLKMLRSLHRLVMHQNKTIVLACFCDDYNFYHRSIIGSFLENYDVSVEYN